MQLLAVVHAEAPASALCNSMFCSPSQPQVTLVNSCYTVKSECPEELLQCIQEEWLALKEASVAPGRGLGEAVDEKLKAA
jgi:hypothetical protein